MCHSESGRSDQQAKYPSTIDATEVKAREIKENLGKRLATMHPSIDGLMHPTLHHLCELIWLLPPSLTTKFKTSYFLVTVLHQSFHFERKKYTADKFQCGMFRNHLYIPWYLKPFNLKHRNPSRWIFHVKYWTGITSIFKSIH